MSQLFEPFKIGPITFRNRFVRSATQDGLPNRTGKYPKRSWNFMNNWPQAASA